MREKSEKLGEIRAMCSEEVSRGCVSAEAGGLGGKGVGCGTSTTTTTIAKCARGCSQPAPGGPGVHQYLSENITDAPARRGEQGLPLGGLGHDDRIPVLVHRLADEAGQAADDRLGRRADLGGGGRRDVADAGVLGAAPRLGGPAADVVGRRRRAAAGRGRGVLLLMGRHLAASGTHLVLAARQVLPGPSHRRRDAAGGGDGGQPGRVAVRRRRRRRPDRRGGARRGGAEERVQALLHRRLAAVRIQRLKLEWGQEIHNWHWVQFNSILFFVLFHTEQYNMYCFQIIYVINKLFIQ